MFLKRLIDISLGTLCNKVFKDLNNKKNIEGVFNIIKFIIWFLIKK